MSLWGDNRPGMTGRIAMWPDRDIQRTSFPPNVTMVFGVDSDDGNSNSLRNADESAGNDGILK